MTVNQFYDLVLRANDLEFIVLQLISPPDQVTFYDLVNVVLHTADHRKIILHCQQRCLVDIPMVFAQHLQAALDGTRELHIDHISNMSLNYLHHSFLLEHEIAEDKQIAALIALKKKYSGFSDLTVDPNWLYTCGDTFFLEVTPYRQAMAFDDDSQTWDSLLRKIEPLLKNIARISFTRETALLWIAQLQQLYNTMLSNMNKNSASANEQALSWQDYPVRALNTLDICRYHPNISTTNTDTHAQFLKEVERLYYNWLRDRQ